MRAVQVVGFGLESVVGMDWNGWSGWIGTGGRDEVEYTKWRHRLEELGAQKGKWREGVDEVR